MTLVEFLKDKSIYIITSLISALVSFMLLKILEVGFEGIVVIEILILSGYALPLTVEYVKKHFYFKKLNQMMAQLDKKTLVCELIDEGNFLESKLFYETLKEATKSMNDEIGQYKKLSNDYMEYINLWIHEIKTPIAAAKLISINNESDYSKSIIEEIDQIDAYTQQVLYYSKSFTVATDYKLSKVSLEDLVNMAIKNDAKMLIKSRINILKLNLSHRIITDKKWVLFIMRQIILNAITYLDKNEKQLTFNSYREEGRTVLSIKDNGMGIDVKDLDRIFDKGYVGENGRKKSQSTGYGLYICRQLCHSLNIGIEAKSEWGNFTEILLKFQT